MNQILDQSENLLLERYSPPGEQNLAPMLFITASPRTGSTLIYQFVIQVFGPYYFSNFVVKHFAEYPIVGVALDLAVNPGGPVGFESHYGKTDEPFGPSEASGIFRNWFGGGQPSQTCSARVLPEKEEHMKRTLHTIYSLTGRPLVTKNAWNCFRIADLCRMFPHLCFLWFRRDIIRSAASDLEARYRKGGPKVWSSATTANCHQIQKLPYWEQVVEQQYEYNRTMEQDLKTHCPGRFVQLWYEDLCGDSSQVAQKLEQVFNSWGWEDMQTKGSLPRFSLSPGPPSMAGDIQKIEEYVKNRPKRFEEYVYSGPHPTQ